MSTHRAFHRWMLIAAVIVAGWPARVSGEAIIALNAHDPLSFYVHGDPTLDVGTGTVQVNSDASIAALFQGTSVTVIAGAINIVGGHLERGSVTVPQNINDGQP